MKNFYCNLLFLSILCPAWGSLVVDLPQNNQEISLKFNDSLKITNVNSFCIRFRLTGIQGYRTLFCTDEFEFCLDFEVSNQYGMVFLNGESFIFTIQKDLVQPYAWHHFCISFDGKSYDVVMDGNIWYQAHRQCCSGINCSSLTIHF